MVANLMIYILCGLSLSSAMIQKHAFLHHTDQILKNSQWKEPKRYDSFAPQRDEINTLGNQTMTEDMNVSSPPPMSKLYNGVQCYVDADGAWRQLSQILIEAKNEIMLAGWWICPDIYLRRPAECFMEFRLDKLLLRKAKEGVKIYILMYHEVKLALGLNSAYSKKRFLMHSNIQVLRSPDTILTRSLDVFWSHHEKIVVVDQSIAFIGGLDLCFGRYDTSEHRIEDGKQPYTWIGKDYANERSQGFQDVNMPEDSLLSRNSEHRMPWHDIHCSLLGEAALDVARHFIQRWNLLCMHKRNQLRLGWCVCCRRGRLQSLPFSCIVPLDSVLNYHININKNSSFKTINSETITSYWKDYVPSKCQILRSLALWSGGGEKMEHSIQNAYLDTIEQAKHYVYIENQFFVSGVEGNFDIKNRIVNALILRIQKAIQRDEIFRVFLVLPLLPGFAGEFETTDELRSVVHYQYQTICRGQDSLIERIRAYTNDPFKYVGIFGLRTQGKLPNGSRITEQIYIHSKLMLVDDEKIIIGSANINDRSLCGDRDSEIAVLMEDVKKIPSILNEKQTYVGYNCYHLRLTLFQEHMGIDNVEENSWLKDPCSPILWMKFKKRAESNTKIYEDIFHVMPSNTVQSLKDLRIEKWGFEDDSFYETQYYFRGTWKGASDVSKSGLSTWSDIFGYPIDPRAIDLKMDEWSIERDLRRENYLDENGWMYYKNANDVLYHHLPVEINVLDKKNDQRRIRRRKWIHKFAIEEHHESDVSDLNNSLHRRPYSISISESDKEEKKLRNPAFRRATVSCKVLQNSFDGDDLSKIRGHLVEFPTQFLQKEKLISTGIFALPKSLFT